VCSSPAVQETHLFCMDQLSTTSSLPVTRATCSLPTTTQLGSPQRRVVILPARGNTSPVKVSTSPKRILSPNVSISVSGGTLPISATYTNCGLADQKCTGAVRSVNQSDSVCISSCVSQYVGSVLQNSDRTLSTTLYVDGILTSSSESASRLGITSVACRESRVQETTVVSSVMSAARQSVSVCSDDHSLSCGKNVSASHMSGHMYQSDKSVSQVSSESIPGSQVRPVNCEASVHHAVAVTHSGIPSQQTVTSSTRTVNVTSIKRICPSVDTQKRNIVVKLFTENSGSGSLNVRTAEQCQPANVTSAGSVSSPKRIVLLTSTAAENISSDCSPSDLQQSCDTTESVNAPAVCQPCPSLETVNCVLTSAASIASTMSSCASQKVNEALTLTLNSSQNSPVVVVDSNRLSSMSVQLPADSSSNSGTKSDDDSDDDSVVIIDADLVPSSPSPSHNNTKRSVTAQNVILLNRHKTSSQPAVDIERSKAVAMDRTEQSRTKRKSVLGTRLLESASDEGIILPASKVFENGGRINQPSRRKSFPQRRTDTSVPQLQFCTKQWKRDINSSQSTSTTASPTCKRSPSRSPKKDTGTDFLSKADGSTKSELPLSSQTNLQCSQNNRVQRKRKPVDRREFATFPEVKRSKRLSPVKAGNKNMVTADKIVHREAAVKLGITGTSLAAHLTETSHRIPVTVSSSSSSSSSAISSNCCGNVKSTQPVDDSSEPHLLGKDKRSMEMSVTNEDGVVENLLVTIIDISSSDEEEAEVKVQSASAAKLDLSDEIETSQSVTSKSLFSNTEKPLQDKSCRNSSTLSSDRQSVSKSLCKPNRVRQKCRQTMQSSVMGRKVLVGHGRQPSSKDLMNSTKIKQLTQLPGKSTSRKRLKNDASGSIKQLKADTDSVSAGHYGPVVRLHGSRDCPTSCSIVSGARDANDEASARLKQKSVVLNSSCYPTSFQLQDSVPWKCVFCQQGSSYRTLGDLFGPYYAKSDSSAKSDDVLCQSSPSKSRRRSAKKSPESGYTEVSKNSEHRRQQLQKYVPSRKSPQKSLSSPDKGIPSEIWIHENCAIWTSGICLSPTGQLCGLEAAVSLSLQTVQSFY